MVYHTPNMSTDSVQCNSIYILQETKCLVKSKVKKSFMEKIYITKCGGLSISWFPLMNFFPWALTVHLASSAVLPQGRPTK